LQRMLLLLHEGGTAPFVIGIHVRERVSIRPDE
jgi:hypothetical protein